ncbi:uncharacterized protein DUF3515 [Streptomyces sp. 846.5]|nr:DUF3515 domain-containing protein [Streptomyces sp. 846.5]TDU04007.1 uncharacterized protein DUF3515 [Streptomyces sp. 846.5]
MSYCPPRRALTALLPATALLLAGCSGGGAVQVAAPTPTGTAAARCGALVKALPGTLLGQRSRPVSPASTTTAAWGDPAITLRCGVGTPGALDPTSSEYDPNLAHHDAQDVNGVCWLIGQTRGGGYRFTTIVQKTYVEVNVPAAYAGQQSPLGGLASAVLASDPADPARAQFNCI